MYSLLIDTHDKDICLCLYKDNKVLESSIKTSERNHTAYVMPMLNELLNNNKIDVHNLNEIISVIGPGSFTGVRIGVTIAKMLAYTLNIPIKTITSLEVIALSNNTDNNKLAVIKDVKGVYAGCFNKDNQLINDYLYLANLEFDKFIEKNDYEIVQDGIYNFEVIKQYIDKIECTNAHAVKPLYIKVIEALKHD